MTSTIWVYSDPMLMRTALIGIDAIMSSAAYQSLVTIFFLFALIAIAFPSMFRLSSITRYYVSIFAVVAVMTLPSMDVTITPTDDPTAGAVTVAAAPAFVALPASIFSTAGKWMAETYEQVSFVLMGISPDLRVFGVNGGVVAGSLRSIMNISQMDYPTPIRSKIRRAFDECVIPTAIMWGSSYSAAGGLEAQCQTAVGAMPGDKVKVIDCLPHLDTNTALLNITDPMPISDDVGNATTCAAYSASVVADTRIWANNFYARDMATGSTSIARSYRATMAHFMDICPGGVCGTVDIQELISSQLNAKMLTEALVDSVNAGQASDAAANMLNLAARSGAGIISGQGLLAYMPMAMDGIIAIMSLLFPLVVVVTAFSAAQGGTVGRLGHFYTGYFAIHMVPAVMAVLNSFMTYFLIYQSDLAVQFTSELAGIVTSPVAMKNIISLSQAPASAMGYMMAAAPAITWAIIHQGSVPAGQMLGNMLNSGGGVAESASLGNFNVDNTSAGNKSLLSHDNSSIAGSTLAATGSLSQLREQVQENAGADLSSQTAHASALREATGSGSLRSHSNIRHAASHLANAETVKISESMGTASRMADTALQNGHSLSDTAKAMAYQSEFVKQAHALSEAGGLWHTAKAMGLNPGDTVAIGKNLQSVAAIEHARRFSTADEIAKAMGFEGGVTSMNGSDYNRMLDTVAQGSIPEAIKQVSGMLHGGHVASNTTAKQRHQMAENLAANQNRLVLQEQALGANIRERFSDGSGHLSWEKLDKGMRNASLADLTRLNEQIEEGSIIASPRQSRALAAYTAERAMAESLAAQQQFGAAEAYGQTLRAESQGRMAHIASSIQAAGGVAAFLQQAGLAGTVEGRKAATFAAAVAQLSDEDAEIYALNDSQLASFASSNGMTMDQAREERFNARQKLLAYGEEWGRSLGVTEYGHGSVSNMAGAATSLFGDVSNLWGLFGQDRAEVNEEGNVQNEGTDIWEQMGSVIGVASGIGAGLLARSGIRKGIEPVAEKLFGKGKPYFRRGRKSELDGSPGESVQPKTEPAMRRHNNSDGASDEPDLSNVTPMRRKESEMAKETMDSRPGSARTMLIGAVGGAAAEAGIRAVAGNSVDPDNLQQPDKAGSPAKGGRSQLEKVGMAADRSSISPVESIGEIADGD